MTLLVIPALLIAQATATDLNGLWGATLRFGPDIRGPLIIYLTADGYRADIAGYSVAASAEPGATAPDLDLVVVFTGGNYNDPVLFTSQRVFVPQYILPAVK